MPAATGRRHSALWCGEFFGDFDYVAVTQPQVGSGCSSGSGVWHTGCPEPGLTSNPVRGGLRLVAAGNDPFKRFSGG